MKADVGLQEKLKGAADLDAAVAIAKEAGFDVSKEDWLKYQTEKTLELTDRELEQATGGTGQGWYDTGAYCTGKVNEWGNPIPGLCD